MPAEPRLLQVFISSPGDVFQEREIARDIIANFTRDHPLLQTEVHLKPIMWDESVYLSAVESPQITVNRSLARPSRCDIVVVIFWSRMGSPLPIESFQKPDKSPYLSGTEWEYEDAFWAAKKWGLPELLVYWRKPPNPSESPIQLARIERFFQAFRTPSGVSNFGWNEYRDPDEFHRKFTGHLEKVVLEVLNRPDPRETYVPLPLIGAVSFLLAAIVMMLSLALGHSLAGNHSAPHLSSLLSVAPGDYFYYPDLNALLFDGLLHPAIFALWITLLVFIQKHRRDLRGGIANNVSAVTLLVVPLLFSAFATALMYYSRYVHYHMPQPLLTLALAAAAFGFYVTTALAFLAIYATALWINEHILDMQSRKIQWNFGLLLLSSLLLLFSHGIAIWVAADIQGVPILDALRLFTLVVDGVGVLVLIGAMITKFRMPSETDFDRAYTRAEYVSMVGIAVFYSILFLLIILMFIQTYFGWRIT